MNESFPHPKFENDIIIGIVIHTNNGLLIPCINSILRHTSLRFKIKIFINNSNESFSLDAIEKNPIIEIIRNITPSGFATNFNKLIKSSISEAPYFLVLNDDTLFCNDVLGVLTEVMNEHKKIAACSPQLFYENRNPQLSGGFFNMPKEIWRILNFNKFITPKLKYKLGQNEFIRKVVGKKISIYLNNFSTTVGIWNADYISGTCMLIRNEAIYDIGYFDENYFMYAEDVDWCLRAKQKEWIICVVPKAHIIHYENSSMSENVKLEREKSSVYFFSRHSSRFSFLIYLFVVSIIFGVKLLIESVNFRNPSEREKRIKNLKELLNYLITFNHFKKTVL